MYKLAEAQYIIGLMLFYMYVNMIKISNYVQPHPVDTSMCHVRCCLLPAALRVADLFLHADSLTEEAVNIFEIQAAVRHALHSTAKKQTTQHIDERVNSYGSSPVAFSKYVGQCIISPAGIFYTIDSSLTLLLPALHVSLCEK